jgi:hypothetical protein
MKRMGGGWLIFGLLLLPLTGSAATLRCGTKLVSDGAAKVEVLAKCGDPFSMTERRETRLLAGQQRWIEVVVETWIYNFGPQQFMQVVTFENGRLVDVTSGNYGT